MNVFYFCSDQFVSVAAVSIVSLMENNKELNTIHFYIVDDGIRIEIKRKLNQLIDSREIDDMYPFLKTLDLQKRKKR